MTTAYALYDLFAQERKALTLLHISHHQVGPR
jgi:hypothetical protein